MTGVRSSTIVVEGVAFSQFYLVSGDRYVDSLNPNHPEIAVGLCNGSSIGAMMFTAFRHHGDIQVLVDICDAEPPPLGAEWQDVVELPLYTMGEVRLKGWDLSPSGTVIDLDPFEEYRVRYAIANGDVAWRERNNDPGLPFPERYRLQFWRAEGVLPSVVVQESAAGQYWGFSHDAKVAVPAIIEAAESVAEKPLSEEERLLAVIDGALGAHPPTAQRIRDGDHLYTKGIHAFVRQLMMSGYDASEVEALIVERASRS